MDPLSTDQPDPENYYKKYIRRSLGSGAAPGHSSEEQSLVNSQCPVSSTTEDCGDAEEDGGVQKGPEGGAAPVREGREGAAWEEGVKVNIGHPTCEDDSPRAGRMSLLP